MPEKKDEELGKAVMVVGGLWILSGMLKPTVKPEAKTVTYIVTAISEDLKRKMEEPDKYATEANFSKNKTIYDAWKPEFEKYGITLPVRDWDSLSLVDKNQQIKVDLLGAFRTYWDKAGLEPKGTLESIMDKVFGIAGIAAIIILGLLARDLLNWYMQRRPPKKEPTTPVEPLPTPPIPTTPAPAPKTVFIWSNYKLYDDKTYSTDTVRYPITTATLDMFYAISKTLWGAAFALYWGHPYEYYYPTAAPKTPEVTPPSITPESPPSITDRIATWLSEKLQISKEWILTHPLEVAIALAAVGALWLIALAEPTPAGEACMAVISAPLLSLLLKMGAPKVGVPVKYTLGVYVQKVDGTKIPSATVKILETAESKATDTNGYASFSIDAGKTVTAEAIKLGYIPYDTANKQEVVMTKDTTIYLLLAEEAQYKSVTYSLDMLLHGWYEKKEFLDEYCVGLRGRSYEPDSADLSLYKGCVFTGMSKGGVYLYSGCQSLWSGTLKPEQEIIRDGGMVKLKYIGGGSVILYKKIT